MSSRPSLAANASMLSLLLTCSLASVAHAVPITSVGGWDQTGFSFVTDGTSNTLAFSESTVLALCFDGVSAPAGIQDGSSNTITFGEASLTVTGGFVRGRQPIGQIVDGSSNTILIGEGTGFCLGNVTPVAPGGVLDGTSNTIILPETAILDICASNVRPRETIVDGTSNTIQFGETIPQSCHTNVRVGNPPTVNVPEPSSGSLWLVGVALAAFAARSRLRRVS